MGKAKTWFWLCRPWSATATLAPFLLVAGMYGGQPDFVWWRWALALPAALALQTACNLLNTWGDDRSGVDAVEGAVVTTPQLREGLVTARAVLGAGVGCIVLAGLCGAPLFWHWGADGGARINWAVAAVAGLGFLGVVNYSTGVKFKYRGLGVPFVFLLMGAIEATGCAAAAMPERFGTFWAEEAARIFLAAAPVGCLVAAIMHGNDMRDIPTDRAAGITTPSTALGPFGALLLFLGLHVAPYAICGWMAFGGVAWGWLPFAAAPLSWRLGRRAVDVYRGEPGNPPWRGLERGSGGVHLVFSALYAISWRVVSC